MRELRNREPQRLVDVDLARGVVNVVLAADDVGDAHVGVIDDDAEVVGRGPVAAADDEVVKLAVSDLDVAADEIVKLHGALGRVLEPDYIRLVRGVLGVIVAAVAVIAGLLALLLLLLAERVDALLGAVALVGKALREHVVDNRVVAVKALGLVEGALVPVEAKPLHRLDDGVSRLLGGSDTVGILYPENELSSVVPCVKPGVQCGSCAADMKEARGARSETCFNFSHFLKNSRK